MYSVDGNFTTVGSGSDSITVNTGGAKADGLKAVSMLVEDARDALATAVNILVTLPLRNALIILVLGEDGVEFFNALNSTKLYPGVSKASTVSRSRTVNRVRLNAVTNSVQHSLHKSRDFPVR